MPDSKFLGKTPKDIRLYHITKSSKVPSILRNGLKTRYSEEARDKVLYLASSPIQSIMWREYNENEDDYNFDAPMTVLSVLIPKGTPLYEDPESASQGGAYLTTSSIPGRNIKAIRKVKEGKAPSYIFTSPDKLAIRNEKLLEGGNLDPSVKKAAWSKIVTDYKKAKEQE